MPSRLRRAALRRLAVLALLALPGAAAAAEACPALPVRDPAPREAQPRPNPDPAWQRRAAEMERGLAVPGIAAEAGVLFLGDSLTQFWTPPLFEQFYGHRHAFNLGIAGDTTQGLLWRLQRLPLGTALRPRLVVLLIGTNNTGEGSRPEDIAEGVVASVREIRRRSPATRVLLLGLLPRGAGLAEPARAMVEAVNAQLARCAERGAEGGAVSYLAPGRMLLDGAGRLTELVSPDRLHLSWVGYGILSAAIEPEMRRLLGD